MRQWLRCRLEFTADSGPRAGLQQGELFALAGKTFRVACREDLSTVLTLPDGEQLTVEDGTAAMIRVANVEFLAKAADIARRDSDPKLAAASMLHDPVTRLMIEQDVARAGLAHLPSALAAALDERRSAGVDAKPLAEVIIELLEMEEAGFPAGWQISSNNRVRIRFDDATRKALIDLVLP